MKSELETDAVLAATSVETLRGPCWFLVISGVKKEV